MKRISLIYKIDNVKKRGYYLYEEGSRACKVISIFLTGFLLQFHQIKELRNGKSVPILGDLYSQIKCFHHDKLKSYSDLLRKAINYSYHEWKTVVRYIKNGN